nr:hypothetical protein BaRGS_027629 [Batillaria attramentaria]
MIVLNFVLFLLIAVGQIVIYWSIQTNSMSTADSARRSRDMAIARRLFVIVMSDFTCWFPVVLNVKRMTKKRSTVMRQMMKADTSLDIRDRKPAVLQATLIVYQTI